MLRRFFTRASVAALALAALSLQNPPQAAALGSQSDSFELTYSKVLPTVGTCVYMTLSGKVTYKTVAGSVFWSGATHRQWIISEPKVVSPKMVVTFKNYSSYSGCYGTGTADGIAVAQRWSVHECSINPSLSVAVPFSVSVGFWPSCSNRNRASYSTSYSQANLKTYTQYNSSSYVKYGTESELDTKPAAPCYAAFVDVTVTQKNGDQASSDSGHTSAKKVCLTPVW